MRSVFLLMALVALAGTLDAKERETMKVTSTAFGEGQPIPSKYAYKGEGENVQPPLAWTGAPPTTREFALICDDPDAPRPTPWVHWVLYGIPAKTTALAAGSSGDAVSGQNDFGELGWGGPIPPRGHGRHRYFFRVLALDQPLGLKSGLTRSQLLAITKGHVLATGELVGTYERK